MSEVICITLNSAEYHAVLHHLVATGKRSLEAYCKAAVLASFPPKPTVAEVAKKESA